jgi:hypothetical protein
LLDKDTTTIEKEYDDLLKDDLVIVDWNFSHMERWLKSTDLSAEKKKFITDKIKLLKEHSYDPILSK